LKFSLAAGKTALVERTAADFARAFFFDVVVAQRNQRWLSGVLELGMAFIQKLYTPDSLLRKVKEP
jgi:hypothetical protein